MEKKAAIQYLWEIIEDTHRSLKKLIDNPLANAEKLWEILEEAQRSLQSIHSLTIGEFYKVTSWNDGYQVLRFDEIIPRNEFRDRSSAPLILKFRCLTAQYTNKYPPLNFWDDERNTAKDIVMQDANSSEMQSLHQKKFNLMPQELPAFLGNTFVGPLMEEYIQKGTQA